MAAVGDTGSGSIADVSVQETWDRLRADPSAVLVDVRTKAEWSFVGVPDLSSLGRRPILLEWSSFPDNRIDPDFADRLSVALQQVGAGATTEIFFLCRSGARSKAAATVMAQRGFARCRNVADGFEGPLDQARQRGRAGGWKAAGLPWGQS